LDSCEEEEEEYESELMSMEQSQQYHGKKFMSSSGASNELKMSKIKVPHELKPITI
jgi:hypothetical protein